MHSKNEFCLINNQYELYSKVLFKRKTKNCFEQNVRFYIISFEQNFKIFSEVKALKKEIILVYFLNLINNLNI